MKEVEGAASRAAPSTRPLSQQPRSSSDSAPLPGRAERPSAARLARLAVGDVLHGNPPVSGGAGCVVGETPVFHFLETKMLEDDQARIPLDDQRIDVTDLKEVDYWTKCFGVSEARLRTAVASAGTFRDDLRVYLGLP